MLHFPLAKSNPDYVCIPAEVQLLKNVLIKYPGDDVIDMLSLYTFMTMMSSLEQNLMRH
jgi:hypothetical protein